MRGLFIISLVLASVFADAWVLQFGMAVAHNFDARIPVPAYWAAFWLLTIPIGWAGIVFALRGVATLIDY
jgi:hypothetical protein